MPGPGIVQACKGLLQGEGVEADGDIGQGEGAPSADGLYDGLLESPQLIKPVGFFIWQQVRQEGLLEGREVRRDDAIKSEFTDDLDVDADIERSGNRAGCQVAAVGEVEP